MDLKDLERIKKEQEERTSLKGVFQRWGDERRNLRNVVICTVLIVILVGCIYGMREMRFVFEAAPGQSPPEQIDQLETQASQTEEVR